MDGAVDETCIGIVIVAYNSGRVLGPCLRSVAAMSHSNVKIVVVDNASFDETVSVVRGDVRPSGPRRVSDILDLNAAECGGFRDRVLPSRVLIRSPINLGFGGAVNLGLTVLQQDPEVDLFWILNPDTEVAPDTGLIFALKAASGSIGMMGGRVLFSKPPHRIQSDGGRIGWWTGICRNINYGLDPSQAKIQGAAGPDYLMGASMVVSRAFLAQAGPMPRDYFLYYEEVEWALRRGSLPLEFVPEAVVYHRGGTAIGTGNMNRAASPLSNYYNYRNRMRFIRRFRPVALPVAYLVSAWHALGLVFSSGRKEAAAAFYGINQFPPPSYVKHEMRGRD